MNFSRLELAPAAAPFGQRAALAAVMLMVSERLAARPSGIE